MEHNISFIGYLDKGMDRVRNANPKHLQSRLEWVLEQNPEIEKDRVAAPPELNDIIYALNKSIHQNYFKDSAEYLASSIAYGAIAYLSIKYAFTLENSNPTLGSIIIFSSGISIPVGIKLGWFAVSDFIEGIKEYSRFKKDKDNRPLTQKERRLAEYVFMND